MSSTKNLHEGIIVFGFMWGICPRKQNLHARKPRESFAKGSASRSSRESRGESRYIVEAHLNIHMHHYLRAIFRESNRERYYETLVTAKAKTVRAKEPRKPSRKLIRIRTKSLPGFRRRSYIYKELLVLRICRNSILPPHWKKRYIEYVLFLEDFRRSILEDPIPKNSAPPKTLGSHHGSPCFFPLQSRT